MKYGQHVRVKPSATALDHYRLTPDAKGVVLCRYKVLSSGNRTAERVDVRFGADRVFWGLPATLLEEIDDNKDVIAAA